jgi:ubiquinone/menaquinone biosynthesis C-methylase UbiE
VSGADQAGSSNAGTIVAMYGPEAAGYEDIWAPELLPFGRRLVELLGLADATSVLEVGCGVGLLLDAIATAAPRATVVGADLTFDMVRRAPARFRRLVMDAQRPALANAGFDALVAAFMLFHLTDPLAGLVGVRRMLRPGGRFGSTTFGLRSPPPALAVWTEELDAAGAAEDPAAGGPLDGENLVNSAEKMASILTDAGFEDVKTQVLDWERPWPRAEFIRWRETLGPTHRRLRSLDDQARERCLARVRARHDALPNEAFVARSEVILSVARRPAGER